MTSNKNPQKGSQSQSPGWDGEKSPAAQLSDLFNNPDSSTHPWLSHQRLTKSYPESDALFHHSLP